MSDLYEGDLDALLANLPRPAQARALVDHHSRIADAFVAEYEAGLYGLPNAGGATSPGAPASRAITRRPTGP